MIRNTKGYYAVEAAIFLPIFIIAILTIGCFIKAAGAASAVTHAAADESRLIASTAYNIKAAPAFSSRLEKRVLADNADISDIQVSRFKFLHGYRGNEGLISFDMNYRVDIGLPLDMQKSINGSGRMMCRAWIGRTKPAKPGSFADMMNDDEGRTVWVFPESGKRYHGHDCTFVTNYPEQMIINDSIRKQYEPCRKCHPEKMAAGSLVYCYPDYGEAYHRGGCRTVEKYTVSMSKQQAESRGYTPCIKCGGR